MTASSRATCAVAEVLDKDAVVLLYSGCGRCVAVVHCPVDHIKACLSLIQPQLNIGIATPWEVLRTPFNVEDAVGSSATYRGEDTESGINQIQIIPVWEDRVIVGEPRQADVGKRRIGSLELRVAVGLQIDARECLVVQRVREWQRDGGHRIISMIADIGCAWHDAAANLTDRVLTYASCCCRCRRWSSRAACSWRARCCWRRTRRRGW